MTKPIDRARQLVTKAVDPATSEEEARTTALIAVRLIAQHRMLEDDPAPPVRPAGRAPIDPLEAFWDIFVRVAGSANGAGSRMPDPPPARQRPVDPSRRRPVEPTYPSDMRPGGGPWYHRLPCEIWIAADRTCAFCGKICVAGDKVWAYRVTDSSPLRVAHMIGCRDRLPAQHRKGPENP